jgi:heme A synthase
MIHYKRALIAIAIFIATSTFISALPVVTSAALEACNGSDTAVCKSAPSDLTNGVLKNVISILLYVAGTIAVIMIIVGAIRYITSDGDSSKAAQAKNTIMYAVVGLVVAVMSFGIVTFVVGRL